MGEGLNEKAEKALAAVEQAIAAANLVINYVEAQNRIIREVPDGWVQGMMLENLRFQYELQVENILSPRLNWPGGEAGEIVTIHRRGGTERNG